MAILKGPGSWNDVPLIVTSTDKAILYKKDEKTGERSPENGIQGRFLTIQVDQSLLDPAKVASGEKSADTNPYLVSERKTWQNDKGEDLSFVDHSAFYDENAYQTMLAAAQQGPKGDGKNAKVASIDNPKGGSIEMLGIRGNIAKNHQSGELFVNVKEGVTCNTNPKFGKSVLERQEKVIAAAREFRAAQKAAGAEKGAPEATIEDPQATVDEPTPV